MNIIPLTSLTYTHVVYHSINSNYFNEQIKFSQWKKKKSKKKKRKKFTLKWFNYLFLS